MDLDLGEDIKRRQLSLQREEGEIDEKFAERLYVAQMAAYRDRTGFMVGPPFSSLDPKVREQWLQSVREQ